MGSVLLIAHYYDHDEEHSIDPADDPCGAFVSGHFVSAWWPTPDEFKIDAGGGNEILLPRGNTAEFEVVGVRVHVTHL